MPLAPLLLCGAGHGGDVQGLFGSSLALEAHRSTATVWPRVVVWAADIVRPCCCQHTAPSTEAPSTPPHALRLVILSLIERDSRLMLVGASSDTVRAFYEAVRDASWRHLSLPPSLAPAGQLSAADVAGLRRATLGALGAMLVVGDAVTIDTRLFRTHVQFLLNLLTAVTSDGWEVAAAAEALG